MSAEYIESDYSKFFPGEYEYCYNALPGIALIKLWALLVLNTVWALEANTPFLWKINLYCKIKLRAHALLNNVWALKASIIIRGGDSYSKVGGLMRGEARQHAITRCDLRGFGDMQNFLGVFWVSEIDSDALSVVYLVLSHGSFMLIVLRKQHYYV